MDANPNQDEINRLGSRCAAAGYPLWSVRVVGRNDWMARAESSPPGAFYTGRAFTDVEAMHALVRAIETDRPPTMVDVSPQLAKSKTWEEDFAALVDERVGNEYWSVRYAAAQATGADLLRQVAELTAKLEARK